MPYQQRIVAFIDFLGFKEIINKTASSEDDLSRLLHALEYCRHHFRPLFEDKEISVRDRQVTHFSDSIIISFGISETSGVFYALLDLQHLLMVLAQNGFICRGGIVAGEMIHTGDVAFGPAFVAAYELESKHALFPRVVVAKEVIELGATFHGEQNSFEEELNHILSILSLDLDGRYYVDYFEKCIEELEEPEVELKVYFDCLADIIKKGLGSSNAQVHAKFVWMATKHNKMASLFNDLTPVFNL